MSEKRPSPVEVLREHIRTHGLLQKDLVPYMGTHSAVSYVLNGKRPLSLRMIRKLHAGLGIPLEVLIQEPPKENTP